MEYFIIDFDSTFIKIEALDTLAEIALKNNPKKEKVLANIQQITADGMAGKIAFDKALEKRLLLFKATQKDIEILIKKLQKNITPSISRNKEFFKTHKDNIYIISGGFEEYIIPIFKRFGIDVSHILANKFLFNSKKQVVGFDKTKLLSKEEGKIKQVKKLQLSGNIHVIGDGFTDYEIKKAGFARSFNVFIENVNRETVAKNADYVLPNFDEFLYLHRLPRALSYPKNRIKVLLLENIDKNAANAFKKEGYTVEEISRALTEKELIIKIKDVSILGIRSKTKITKRVLDHANKLLTIGAFCIGTNQIDLEDSAGKGIAVFNAPYSNTRSVVEFTIGLIIMLLRQTFDNSTKVHNRIWDKSAKNSFEIRGKKLGILGYGNIGSQLSVLAEGLGMNVYFYDIQDKLALGTAKESKSLSELLKTVDIVTIHIDGRVENTHLIADRELKSMKKGSYLINTSRGHVVDLEALKTHLKNDHIQGAAIDVYPKEPEGKTDNFTTVLQGIPNVILTPHIAGSTVEAQQSVGEFVSEKLKTFIDTGATILSVNFPELQLPKLHNLHRFIHIHKNVPGVLAKINNVLAENNINIEGQYLKTNEDIGYVITDVGKKYDSIVLKQLRKIPETIRFRVLY